MKFKREEEEKEQKKREIEIMHRRDTYKRISISEIRKHAKLHDITVEDNLNQLRRKRFEENKFFMGQKELFPKSLSSKYLRNVIEEERNNRALYKLKENEAQEKRDKVNRFSIIVQDIYWSKERKEAEKKINKEMAVKKKRENRGLDVKLQHDNYIH